MRCTHVWFMSRAEVAARMEREARRRLGMSAEEVVLAYREGRLEDPFAVTELLILGCLLKRDDPLFVPPHGD